MPWQTQVPLWVLTSASDYIIPTDTGFETKSEFQKLDSAIDAVQSSSATYTHKYPGLVPDIRIESEIKPTQGGSEVLLKFTKGVGFYGVVTTILDFDESKLNTWTFPIERRNFGFVALARNGRVSLNSPVHYDEQFHLDAGIISVSANYDVERRFDELLNDIDEYALNEVHGFQYPSVVTQVAFLPILEVWAVKFFQANS